ncbi:MAG: hypothetical protein KAS93_07805 [Gammaproteobacteria bacterium]|nr:hypothetical protein [Gammaproteobacteria bacterium]
MATLIELIADSGNKEEIKRLWQKKVHDRLLSPFVPLAQARNKTLYEYLKIHGKFYGWDLEDFVAIAAIDINGCDSKDKSLLAYLICDNDLANVKMLLRYGAKVYERDFDYAEDEIKEFFDYQPGRDQKTIYEFCSHRHRQTDYLIRVNALLLDRDDTTDEDSCLEDASLYDWQDFPVEVRTRYGQFRSNLIRRANGGNSAAKNKCRLVAARGMHFAPKYFPPTAQQRIIDNRHEQVATFSQATLFDAGYDADSEVDEDDAAIIEQHNKIIDRANALVDEPDKKERQIGKGTKGRPAATRNNIIFGCFYYRFIQVYINSYHRLFAVGAITKEFGFVTNNNPIISASWKIDKAAMYGSGHRIAWDDKREIRRDPHYRRFNGKPKHPVVGYVDLFDFDIDYVRLNGDDRYLLFKKGKIFLSSMYQYEAEVLFFSMIPKQYHMRRYMIQLPVLSGRYNRVRHTKVCGIRSKGTYESLLDALLKLPSKKSNVKPYQDVVGKITEKAMEAQAKLIEYDVDSRLFSEQKVRVYDHGEQVSDELPKPGA